MMDKCKHITILGGGPAGLAVGYYAKKNGLPFTIYEAKEQTGGNCVTLRHGDFLFDSGAHRFHDRDREITKEIKALLGDQIERTYLPSHIYYKGKFIIFPLQLLDLIKVLGFYNCGKALIELIKARFAEKRPIENFETFARYVYGSTIAEMFLTNYSEKLWGMCCDKLSPYVASTRLSGLNLRALFINKVLRRKSNSLHLEGPFYYPSKGIGAIADRLAEVCKEENIQRQSKVTKVIHRQGRITAIEINGSTEIKTDIVVSTLPLNYFLQIMWPRIPEEVLILAKELRYRSMMLMAFFLNKDSVTKSATLYFSDFDFLFTRVYEPKNRSSFLSSKGKTSLVAEIPCQQGNNPLGLGDDELINHVRTQLVEIGLIKEEDIFNIVVHKFDYAYPILQVDQEKKIQQIQSFLSNFSNLTITGRNGSFKYAWIHNMLRDGQEIIKQYMGKQR